MLQPRKHITKREIKEDALVTAYFRVRKFIQKYSRHLNIGLLAVLIIVVVAVFMFRSKRNAEFTATERLGVAEQSYDASNYLTLVDELTQIVNAYPGTRAAGEASFYIGNTYFMIEDYVNAQKYYQLYMDDYSDNDLFSVSAMAGVATCYEVQNRFIEAAQLYEKAGKRYSRLFHAPFYLKDAARCYGLAGESEKAKMTYRMIIDQYPESSIKQEVEFLLESL